MIPSLSPSTNLFLNALSRLQTTITTTTAQISSGSRISQPSDAADQISPLLQLQASLGHNQSIASNLSRVQSDVSVADQALSSASQLLNQATSLGAQGANGTATDATRSDIAQQLRSIQGEMVSLANTQGAGRYLFGGDQDTSPPYGLNLNQLPADPQNGVDRLFTPPLTATRQIEYSKHSFMPVDQTAQDLFDHRNQDGSLASDNVFAALNGLRVALETPDNQAGITTAQAALKTASDYLNSKETFYGHAQTQIASAVTQIDTQNLNLKQQISDIRDTDVVQAALELTAAETQNQAALAAEAKMPHTSLFDFLG